MVRFTGLASFVAFDAIAPYHPTAVGLMTRVPRRPTIEHTTENINIAVFYSVTQIYSYLMPHLKERLNNLMLDVGLDLDYNSQDLTTPKGIGNYVVSSIIAQLNQDAWNELGDRMNPALTERTDQGRRYWDYTGYEPVNTAYKLIDAGRWQPAIVDSGSGIFRVQQFVTPQWALATPFSYSDLAEVSAPPPTASDPNNAAEYRAQADTVLRASADMTDEQKMMAEFFDDKLRSLAGASMFFFHQQRWTTQEFAFQDTLWHIALWDTGIAIWRQKRHHDAVRPFSAIRHLYGNTPVTAWGGPHKGTQSIPAAQWRSYLATSDHPEYPSATAAFCAAYTTSLRLYFGSDELNWFVPVMQGSSLIEPGFTPMNNITLGWNTFTEFSDDCGNSRFWSGVHFPASIPAGQAIGRAIARRAYDFFLNHVNGTPP